ncbi:MAG: NAD-dependent epimerase/dehydratase family protein [Alphaproteobacteria bacterium]|nr:NAD-dependent epimerase/dehydratase family protein [Alphaproteobacteria bacterium]
MRRVVVLGAGGFLGTNLCCGLMARGWQVKGFGRPPRFPRVLADTPWITAEFADAPALARAVTGADVVFHLLGTRTIGSAEADYHADLRNNVDATLRLLDTVRSGGAGRIVFASSGGAVYGHCTRLPVTEDASTLPISAYGIGKLLIEKYLHLYWHLHRVPYRVARIGNPYGPYQLAHHAHGVVPAMLASRYGDGLFEIWGDGSVVRDYIYVEDAVEALIRLGTWDGETAIVNIGTGLGTSLVELLGAVEAASGGPLRRQHLASRPVDAPANVLDCRRAADLIDWRAATSLIEGLQRTVAWFQEWRRAA